MQRTGTAPAKKDRGSIFTRIAAFYRGVITEMKKVTWPSKEDLKTYTIVVLVSAIILSVLMGGWDVLLAYGLRQFLALGA